MIEEHGKIERSIYLDYDFTLYGMITGDVVVGTGSVFVLHGTCAQNLVMEHGSRVYLHSTVNGNVSNNSGILEVYGTVNGYVNTSEDGKTFIDNNAVIRRGRQE